ncbi:MAG TPA: hypothetical protein VNM22_14545 [Candidatus Limnocylindrales bacterium]|nr:hypothetical protein [Candidatus Limnocylindrales bacterium]
MSKLPLTLACWDYDRVKPLMLKQVEPEGIALNLLPYAPDDSVWRMVRGQEYDASEMTMGTYVLLRSLGQAPYIAIPVFLARFFPHSGIFVNTKANIHEPADLRGKKVGAPQYQMTTAVWTKGILQHDYGVMPETINWYLGRAEVGLDLPPNIKWQLIPQGTGKMLADLLIEGELDALFMPRVPPKFKNGPPHIKQLFANPRQLEIEYYKRTGIFPIMHCVVIKESLYRENPWIAFSLYRAFCKARDICYEDLDQTLEGLKYMVPWLDMHMNDVRQILGKDFWPYGIKANRKVLETFIEYMLEQHLIKKKLSVEELFCETTLDT